MFKSEAKAEFSVNRTGLQLASSCRAHSKYAAVLHPLFNHRLYVSSQRQASSTDWDPARPAGRAR